MRTTQDLSLVKLRQPELKKWKITRTELIASSPAHYQFTAKWSQAIYDQFANVMGLVWTSNQCDPDSAYMFFGDRVPESSLNIERVREGRNDLSFLTDAVNAGMRSGTRIID